MKILVVDDEKNIVEELIELLEGEGHVGIGAGCGEEALQSLRCIPDIDLMIFDVNMPGTTGLDLVNELPSLTTLRAEDHKLHTICMTGSKDDNLLKRMLGFGVDGFQFKPVDPDGLLANVRDIAVQVSTKKLSGLEKEALIAKIERQQSELSKVQRDLFKSQKEGLTCLALAAEHKDVTTGKHIERIGAYARHMALCLGWTKQRCDLIEQAAPLHDVGKIGTPDLVLNYPGKLSDEQFSIMKNHAKLGAEILGKSDSPVMQMAAKIAYCHHERWDGTGYPRALSGNQIPPEAAITSLVDVYDALRSIRPYKGAMAHAKAIDIICNGDGRTMPEHFSPELLKIFLTNHRQFDIIYKSFESAASTEASDNVVDLKSDASQASA